MTHRARAAPTAFGAASDWRTQAAIVVALQMMNMVFESMRIDHAMQFESALDWTTYKADELARSSFHHVAAVLVLQGIQRLGRARPHRSAAAVLAMLVAGLASAVLGSMLPGEPVAVRIGASASTTVWTWYMAWTFCLLNLLALLAVDGLRRRQQAANRLAAVQEHGRIVRQQVASAQLLAIQARIDPQLLFEMLAAVRAFYERDAARAERLLDELSAFLRAALPRLRHERSTLEIECALVQSYARLLEAAGTACIELKLDIARGIETAGFPAGVLLPLLAGPGAGPRRIVLSAHTRADALCLHVADSKRPDEATLGRLRGSLHSLYGERGALRLQAQDASAQLELEVPLERA